MSKQTATYDLAGQLRRAIAKSGMTRFKLSRLSGVGYSPLYKFVAGEGDLTLASASKICAVLGLTLALAGKKKGR